MVHVDIASQDNLIIYWDQRKSFWRWEYSITYYDSQISQRDLEALGLSRNLKALVAWKAKNSRIHLPHQKTIIK